MKVLVSVLVSLFFVPSAFALAIKNFNNDQITSVVGFQNAPVISVDTQDAEDLLLVQMIFSLSGCLDKLAPISYITIPSEDELLIVVTALQVKNAASDNVRCVAQNTPNAAIVVPLSEEMKQKYSGKVKILFTATAQEFNIMTSGM